jgi:hypothetical protein
MIKGLNEKKATFHFNLDIKNWGLVTLQTPNVKKIWKSLKKNFKITSFRNPLVH